MYSIDHMDDSLFIHATWTRPPPVRVRECSDLPLRVYTYCDGTLFSVRGP